MFTFSPNLKTKTLAWHWPKLTNSMLTISHIICVLCCDLRSDRFLDLLEMIKLTHSSFSTATAYDKAAAAYAITAPAYAITAAVYANVAAAYAKAEAAYDNAAAASAINAAAYANDAAAYKITK